MIRFAFMLILLVCLSGCASSNKGTLAELRQVEIVIEDETADGSLDKAIAGYEQFLEKANDPRMTPEAIRRLADLKVEKEYGLIAEDVKSGSEKSSKPAPKKNGTTAGAKPERVESKQRTKEKTASAAVQQSEKDSSVVSRTAAAQKTKKNSGNDDILTEIDLKRVGAQEAVALYRKLLDEFPQYEQNHQVLYQLSRALEEQGEIEEAMQIMGRMVKAFPDSPHLDEVQFRRAEYFFSGRKYSDAAEAYRSVVSVGEESEYYLLSLYKLGWSYYKQDAFKKAIHEFIALLDYKVANNFDFEKDLDDKDEKQARDTLRIIGQSFSNLGGVQSAVDYFSRYGRKDYEYVIYDNLGDYYSTKKLYSNAVKTYAAFVDLNPYHRMAPLFVLKVIVINETGGFPTLVIKAKKEYAENYGFGTNYWKHYNPDDRPEVIAGLKGNLIELANHYHALYQNKKFFKNKVDNLKQALHWYREFLHSFPMLEEAPGINFQMAELLLENNMYAEAAQEYEKVAYEYPVFEKADKAGFAAVYAYRQHYKQVDKQDKDKVKRDVIRVSLKFAGFYPKHEKASVVHGAAVDDLYALKDYKTVLAEGKNLLKRFPRAGSDIRRSTLLAVAHSAYELKSYDDAENAYAEVLKLLPKNDKTRPGLVDNLVASIYKQGEAENRRKNYKKAADHFLRVAKAAPESKLRATAEFDGAVALINVEEWEGAAKVLTRFRKSFPKHKLQHDVTKKLAYVYSEAGKIALAAAEFERIVHETTDSELRREATLTAAEYYGQVNAPKKAAALYQSYIKEFPEPVDVNIETRDKLAAIYLQLGQQGQYLEALHQIVALESGAGSKQTERTRFVAGKAALVLAKPEFDAFVAVRLVKPFQTNLQRKQALMKKVTEAYTGIFDYGAGDVTAEATFHLAETYADFSNALLASERPSGLSALELEQYELALEEQAYPFEEKAIEMHQGNHELLSRGVYNKWIEMSIGKLAVSLPARYNKPETENSEFASLANYRFENMELYEIAQREAARAAAAKAKAQEPVNDKKGSRKVAPPAGESHPSANGES